MTLPTFPLRSYLFSEYTDARNFIGGQWVEGTSPERSFVTNPRHARAMGTVHHSTREDVAAAVEVAHGAQKAWGTAPIRERAQVLFRLRGLMLEAHEELSWLLSHENGKTIGQARAEVNKAIECLEYGISLENMADGGALEVSRGVTCRVIHEPLGVVGVIAPFNFPTMVPMWMVPQALVAGNALVLKPSEKVPFSMMRVADLLQQAGLPDGIFNLVQGGREAAEAIVDHQHVRAVGFVGSTPIARALYERGTALGKKMLCLGGAKNHLVVVPDADLELTASNVVASFTGCAGQRCMAAANLMAVGDCQHIIDAIAEQTRALVLGEQMGPIVTQASLDRITGFIEDAERLGADILVDGRGAHVEGEGGYWLGATIIDQATLNMGCAREEIFGPVLSILRVGTLDEAIAIENGNPYGNAASIYTTSGAVAEYASRRFEAGMIGVNIGVPVPREPFAFGGWNESKFGSGDVTGWDGYRFFTRPRKVTSKWAMQADQTWMS